MSLILLSMTHTSVHLPQLADRTESLNRSIQKRYVYLLSGVFKDRVGEGLSVEIRDVVLWEGLWVSWEDFGR